MKQNDIEATKPIKKKRVAYHCPICCEPSHLKLHRNWFLKYVLFFMPIRKYFCPGCEKPYYVNIRKAPKGTVIL